MPRSRLRSAAQVKEHPGQAPSPAPGIERQPPQYGIGLVTEPASFGDAGVGRLPVKIQAKVSQHGIPFPEQVSLARGNIPGNVRQGGIGFGPLDKPLFLLELPVRQQ